MADEPKDPPAKDEPDPKPDPDLGDAGKKALDEERRARRAADARAKKVEEELKALQDKDKSELDRLREENAKLTTDLGESNSKVLRMEVAAEKGVKARWLSGSTREELEAAAEEYLEDHPASAKPEPVPGKPAVDLKGGGDPTEDPPVDVKSVVDSIPRGF